jgi:LDH2 family malate/lactate/ureidoglycolate dehydrogenase
MLHRDHRGTTRSFITIDEDALAAAAEFNERVRRLIEEVLTACQTTGIEQVLLPGEIDVESPAARRERGLCLAQERS